VAANRFRADLLYRLNVFTLTLPPLRERREDLPELIDYYLQKNNEALEKHVRQLSPKTTDLMMRYDWPGNVRELQSVIKFALVQAAGDTLTPECLPESVRGVRGEAEPTSTADDDL